MHDVCILVGFKIKFKNKNSFTWCTYKLHTSTDTRLSQNYLYLVQKPFALSSLGRLYILVMLIKFSINQSPKCPTTYTTYINIVPHTLDIFKLSSFETYVYTLVAHKIYKSTLYTINYLYKLWIYWTFQLRTRMENKML